MTAEDRRTELIAAVRAAPADDGPLLVLADFLQERGEPLGELIQVSIARSKDPSPELDWRERRLAKAAFPGNLRWKLVNGRATAFGHAGLFRGVDRGGAHTWIRFYPDGSVCDASVMEQQTKTPEETGALVARWLDPVQSGSKGRHTVDPLAFLDGSPVAIEIAISETKHLPKPVRIELKGTITGETIAVEGYSHTTKARWPDVYTIVACPADSREPEAG